MNLHTELNFGYLSCTWHSRKKLRDALLLRAESYCNDIASLKLCIAASSLQMLI